ncbi:hypothetical protein S83_003855 [Arachis hypogaea]
MLVYIRPKGYQKFREEGISGGKNKSKLKRTKEGDRGSTIKLNQTLDFPAYCLAASYPGQNCDRGEIRNYYLGSS